MSLGSWRLTHRRVRGAWTRRRLLALGAGVVGLTGAAGSIASGPAQTPAAEPAIVFDGVTVIDVENGRRLLAQRVVVVGNHIQTVGAADKTPIPTGARVVDARGQYLIPGLWDMHIHPMRYTDFFYPFLIANGVTGIRDAWSPVPLDTQKLWRREILAGQRVGPPRQILAGPAIDAVYTKDGCNPTHGHMCLVVDSGATRPTLDSIARHVVDSLKAAGADHIKIYSVTRPMYFALAAAARRAGMPFGGHIVVISATEASDSGATFLDHPIVKELDSLCLHASANLERCTAMAARFKRQNTWWVPTLNIYTPPQPFPGVAMDSATLRPYERHLRLHAREFWVGPLSHDNWLRDSVRPGPPGSPDRIDTRPPKAKKTRSFFGGNAPFLYLQRAQSAGLPLLTGTDTYPSLTAEFWGGPSEMMPPGFSLQTEVVMLVASGLATPLEALRAATLNPAQALHRTDSLGTVARGKLADLVLLDADPLADITNITTIRAVMANGRYYDRAALDQLVTEVQAKARTVPPSDSSRRP